MIADRRIGNGGSVMRKMCLLLVVLLLGVCMCAAEQEINLSNYSYDELYDILDNTNVEVAKLREQLTQIEMSIEEKQALIELVNERIEQIEWNATMGEADRQISLDMENIEMMPYDTVTLTAECKRMTDDAPWYTEFVWSSSNNDIAVVNAYGKVTAVAYGDAVITVSAKDNEACYACAQVHVGAYIEKITIAEDSLFVVLKDDSTVENLVLDAEIEPEYANMEDIRWSSSNERVASVDENGIVTILSDGTATITAEAVNPAYKYTRQAQVKIKAIRPAEDIELDREELVTAVGTSTVINALVYPENATNKEVVWESSDKSIAQYTHGMLTCKNPGDAVVTASVINDSGDTISKSINVHVYAPVKIAEMQNYYVYIPVGKSAEAPEIKLTPSNAEYDSIIWKSSDENVVAVDEDGRIHGIDYGKAKVLALISNLNGGAAVEATCYVTVVEPVAFIRLDQTDVILEEGKAVQLKASVLPEEAEQKKVTWYSTDPSIASVSMDGFVRANGCGECTVIAESTDGSDVKAMCNISVLRQVKSITVLEKSVKLGIDESTKVTVNVSPTTASIKDLKWESSDYGVAKVDDDGVITAVNGGSCTIRCSAMDGSGKFAEFDVFVPSLYIGESKYMVTEKTGIVIPVTHYGKGKIAVDNGSKKSFDAIVNGDNIVIMPKAAGSAKLTITDTAVDDARNAVSIEIFIERSALYNDYDYPAADYAAILNHPRSYMDSPCSVSGKVIQRIDAEGETILRVAFDNLGQINVFYIKYSNEREELNAYKDSEVTVYGICRGVMTYTNVLGNMVTLPLIEAERIITVE